MPKPNQRPDFMRPNTGFITDPIARLTLFLRRTSSRIKQVTYPHYMARKNAIWKFIVLTPSGQELMCEVERSANKFYLRTGPNLELDSWYGRGQSARLENNILAAEPKA